MLKFGRIRSPSELKFYKKMFVNDFIAGKYSEQEFVTGLNIFRKELEILNSY